MALGRAEQPAFQSDCIRGVVVKATVISLFNNISDIEAELKIRNLSLNLKKKTEVSRVIRY